MAKLPIPLWILSAPVAVLLLITGLLVLFGPVGERPPDEEWKGPFYSNPDDPSLLVPKRYGIGWTLNFGNRWAWPVLVMILAIALLPLLFIAINIHNLAELRNQK